MRVSPDRHRGSGLPSGQHVPLRGSPSPQCVPLAQSPSLAHLPATPGPTRPGETEPGELAWPEPAPPDEADGATTAPVELGWALAGGAVATPTLPVATAVTVVVSVVTGEGPGPAWLEQPSALATTKAAPRARERSFDIIAREDT